LERGDVHQPFEQAELPRVGCPIGVRTENFIFRFADDKTQRTALLQLQRLLRDVRHQLGEQLIVYRRMILWKLLKNIEGWSRTEGVQIF
jgi:hypothetical protein